MMSLVYRVADRLRHRVRRKSMSPGEANGRRGEDLAHRLLRREGYTVVARNYRPPAGGGELDLIAWDGSKLAMVEVKTRTSAEFGTPDAAVDEEKRNALERAARDYARRAGVEWENVRFDVVNVVLDDPPRIELRRDAFQSRRTL